MKKKKGQVLVLVLLVVVVALAVGLSVASRNLTNLRTTTQTEQSQRAFNAAEGGIESILPDLVAAAAAGSQTIPVGDLTATVTVNAETEYLWTIPEGEVGQVKLVDEVGLPTDIQIEWAPRGGSEDNSAGGTTASIEITKVSLSGGVFSQERWAYAGDSAASSGNEDSFDSPTSCSSIDYTKCVLITFNTSNDLILRIRPFWNQATVKVTAIGGSLPDQLYDVTSTASTELGLTRKIQVTKTAFPQLPAVFDYVLYSEGGIVK